MGSDERDYRLLARGWQRALGWDDETAKAYEEACRKAGAVVSPYTFAVDKKAEDFKKEFYRPHIYLPPPDVESQNSRIEEFLREYWMGTQRDFPDSLMGEAPPEEKPLEEYDPIDRSNFLISRDEVGFFSAHESSLRRKMGRWLSDQIEYLMYSGGEGIEPYLALLDAIESGVPLKHIATGDLPSDFARRFATDLKPYKGGIEISNEVLGPCTPPDALQKKLPISHGRLLKKRKEKKSMQKSAQPPVDAEPAFPGGGYPPTAMPPDEVGGIGGGGPISSPIGGPGPQLVPSQQIDQVIEPAFIENMSAMDQERMAELENERALALASGDLARLRYVEKQQHDIIERYMMPEAFSIGPKNAKAIQEKLVRSGRVQEKIVGVAADKIAQLWDLDLPVVIETMRVASVEVDPWDDSKGIVEWILQLRDYHSAPHPIPKVALAITFVDGNEALLAPYIWDSRNQRYMFDSSGLAALMSSGDVVDTGTPGVEDRIRWI